MIFSTVATRLLNEARTHKRSYLASLRTVILRIFSGGDFSSQWNSDTDQPMEPVVGRSTAQQQLRLVVGGSLE